VNPTTRVESQDGGTTVLRVDGLVCDTVCAVRTGEALAAMPGVTNVRVDYDAGTATIEGTAHDAAAYERAVTGAVAGKPLRRLIEHLSGRSGAHSKNLTPGPFPTRQGEDAPTEKR
jgi:copper chaperone CopZ